MVDKEKVIKGMKACCGEENECIECPYDAEYKFSSDCMTALIKDLRELLKDYDNALKLMVLQYCTDDDDYLWNRCMVAGEAAFEVLGVKNGDRMEVEE